MTVERMMVKVVVGCRRSRRRVCRGGAHDDRFQTGKSRAVRVGW